MIDDLIKPSRHQRDKTQKVLPKISPTKINQFTRLHVLHVTLKLSYIYTIFLYLFYIFLFLKSYKEKKACKRVFISGLCKARQHVFACKHTFKRVR